MQLLVKIEGAAGRAIEVPGQENLARALWLYGLAPTAPLCGGLGRCGSCRVRFSGLQDPPLPLAIECDVLGDAVNQGWRLACRHTTAEAEGFSLTPQAAQAAAVEDADSSSTASTGPVRRLAVDFGTSTVHWRGLDANGRLAAHGQALNPQVGAGADIVSRLGVAASAEGRHRLSEMACAMLRHIVTMVAPAGVEEVCLAANTAMTAIILDLSVDGLLGAPYRRPLAGNVTVRLPDLPPIWLPPQPAPFIGGDVAAGMAWALSERPSFPLLLADLGTNGECVLAVDENTAFAASVPLGPALEGMGLACGGAAGPGAVTAFTIGPGGLEPRVMGGGEPKFLSGTGVLSLLDALRRLGVLMEWGGLAPISSSIPLARRLLESVVHTDEGWRLPLPGGLYLSSGDVEAVLKVRAAFVLAMEGLLERAGIQGAELGSLLLAGSLGEHAPLDALDRLGFLPRGAAARTRAVGNAALAGAALLLVRPELRESLANWCKTWNIIDITARPRFMERFAAAMCLRS